MATIPKGRDEGSLVEIPISQDEGTFTAPPPLQRVPLGHYVKWVKGVGVDGFLVTFEQGSPFHDVHGDLFFFQEYTNIRTQEVFDNQNEDGQQATKRGIFHYTVAVTARDGKTWVSGGCEIHVN